MGGSQVCRSRSGSGAIIAMFPVALPWFGEFVAVRRVKSITVFEARVTQGPV
jgi:hypothetical protein